MMKWTKHPSAVAAGLAVFAALVSIAVADRQIGASDRALRETLREQDRAQRQDVTARLATERRDAARERQAQQRDGRRAAYVAFSQASGRFLGCVGDCTDPMLRRADAEVFTAEDLVRLLGSADAIRTADAVVGLVRRLTNAELGSEDETSDRLFFRLQDAMQTFSNTARADLRP